MSDHSPPSSSGMPGPHRRRSSIVELFNPRSSATASASSSPPSAAPTSAIPPPPHRRGMSATTVGLSGSSPTQSNPYTAFAKQRRASVSTTSSGSPEFRNSFGDEPAVIEEDDHSRVPSHAPASPSFARRVSFGAQALRDVKAGGNAGVSGGGRRPSTSLYTLDENNENTAPKNGVSSRTATTAGEGFNWSDALRDRTKRSPSFSSSASPFASRVRSNSSTAAEPPKEMSAPVPVPQPAPTPARMKKPDQLGERMLRGDFMMD